MKFNHEIPMAQLTHQAIRYALFNDEEIEGIDVHKGELPEGAVIVQGVRASGLSTRRSHETAGQG